MRALLDVNVLLALFDEDHDHHDRARAWLSAEIADGWASCPITQNGFVRIISQPKYPSPVPIAAAIERLAQACATGHHEFWSCAVSVVDPASVDPAHLTGPKQVTDVYLLATAVANDGRFVTFDSAIPLSAVPGADGRHLVVI
ncbi:MAG TPA: TA system VapC family ribonuclease toxin [Ilumatobacter sp.]|nr:TA system VapC family ribonuclease toxin [Ilumatobacter sp.]